MSQALTPAKTDKPWRFNMEITVTPAVDLIDVARAIRVTGLPVGAEVVIRATSTRAGGSQWQAEARFRSGPDGMVDTARDAPLDGSYGSASAMGLIWSQVQIAPPTAEATGAASVADVVTSLTATTDHGQATAQMRQILMSAGVTRHEVHEDGIVGVLYLPAGVGPYPAVMVQNGSGGGMNEPRAALYAARGYAAFALAVFNAPGRPRYINDLPLEYFRDALDWMRARIKPADDFVAITGQSRGGEAVLLIAATYPERVSATMAYVPASCVHSAQSAGDPARGRLAPTWTLDGRPLPHLWDGNRTGTYAPYLDGPEPKRHEYATLTAMADHEAYLRARIRVEDITTPVLLIHGTDDGWWPTDYHCDLVEQTMRAAGRQVERMRFQDAGHAIVFPYVPATDIVIKHPVSGVVSTNGGTAAANAQANEQVWPGVLDFLHRARRR
ncbi:acyl-CoA thioesterase/bile acid-CoA:amino acid N-acyltransferase family protein [Ketogulonicigenium vulgare]|uniref:acyl-CoA thioesterase/bile acid-CoA:amino acid N-acyltransferase family protein n=1 Tax=Ketogulonicigenium vulgare TaxID=92945 RepID=UPI0023591D13|nr:acyl-CoA thioester hydrolase/BAAT C-terminal domain-containing protein [Ketogulonicigenium vulgare]